MTGKMWTKRARIIYNIFPKVIEDRNPKNLYTNCLMDHIK